MSGARTDFSQYTHQQLYAMLFASDPQTASNSAQVWGDTAAALYDQAGRLDSQLKSFQHLWQGDAADSYRSMITDLAAGIRKVGDTMAAVRDLDYGAGDALTKARKEMPAPVDVPTLSPTVVAAATTPLPSDPNIAPTTMMALQQQQRDAVDQVNQYQQTVAAANEAHARAVQIMTALGNDYTTTESSMPASPDAGTAPALPTGGTAVTDNPNLATIDYTPGADQGLTTGTAVLAGGAALAASSPLFGKMFQAGLAAASAAVNGQFTGLKLPSFLNKKKDGTGTGDGKATDAGTTGDKLGSGAGSDTGGVGGGGADLGSGAGDTNVPSPADALSSAPTSAGAGLAGAGAAAAAAGSAAKSAGFMPAMPMGAGMMGMSDMGGGRRIPPWLVETEDVWGESSVVSPTVIGENP